MHAVPRATPPDANSACHWCKRALARWHHVPVDPLKETENPHANTYWCKACGHGALHPLPSEAEVPELYRSESYYTHVAPQDGAERNTVSLLDRARMHLANRLDRGKALTLEYIVQVLAGKPSVICDLGCGHGQLAASLAELGHEVTGVEIDPDVASQCVLGNYKLLAGTAEKLPEDLPRGHFDVVVMRHVLEHCRDPVLALKNAKSLLKPGGRLLCEVPNNEALGLVYSGAAWLMLDVPRHLHFFSKRSLEKACVAAGFKVQEAHYANYERQFTNEWIADERTLYERMTAASDRSPTPKLTPNSRLRAWRLLWASLGMSDAQRYDSVGVVALRS